MDAVKDYITHKRFGVLSYVCLIVHFLCGLILTAVTNEVRKGEFVKFSCAVDTKSTAAYKTYVEKTCYSRYEQTYNSPLPLYGFVLLCVGLQVFVSVIYSLVVSSRVDEIADRIANGSEEPRTEVEETSRGFYVFYRYFFHLVVRSLFGIVFTVLQHTVFYPRGFDFKFSCGLQTTDVTSQIAKNSSVAQINGTSITCENSTASEKKLWGIIVSILHIVLALIILWEVIYLCPRFSILNRRFEVRWISDTEFIKFYLLRKRYPSVDDEQTRRDNNSPLLRQMAVNSSNPDKNNDDPRAGASFGFCIEFYKQQVLKVRYTPDICYKPNAEQGHTYIDIVFHTGRAQHKFTKEMNRHEIYDVYMEVPSDSTRLEEIKDLFYPNEDTEYKFPRIVLAVGRPGTGKTVLTEKIMRDWANGIDEFYDGKIAFYFKFSGFNFEELKSMSLKTFLRYGSGLSEERFESIFEEISNNPGKAIFIFDGLDEFDGDLENCLRQSQRSNDPDTPMPPMTLFIELLSSNMLHGATVLVTSRPTANAFCSKLKFERSVEIIGFTSNKIEEYVNRFCENHNRTDLKPMIWNHIKSSPDLLTLCCIPFSSHIVCDILAKCLSGPAIDTSIPPITLTKIYDTVINHFRKHHDRNKDDTCSGQMLGQLQKLAFLGMENGQLVFKKNLFDEQMRTSGLVNCLTNPVSFLQTQFCFIHLTIQEFLAAKHVIETLSPGEIENFISIHIESDKWHLVLQFIAGLLGEKIKMSGSEYQDCVLAFAKSLTWYNRTTITLKVKNMFIMKCFREVDDEDIIQKACDVTDLGNVRTILPYKRLSANDWEAVTFVCKNLKNLTDLHLVHEIADSNCLLEIGKLLQQRCFERLFVIDEMLFNRSDLVKRQLIDAINKSECTLNHEHSKLRNLNIAIEMTDEDVSSLCSLIRNGHARHLETLNLSLNKITSGGISQFREVLNDKLCSQLTDLDFGFNAIGDEGVRVLCTALIHGHCKLRRLNLGSCSLTAECVCWLSEVLCDEHGQLSYLRLDRNVIGDEGVRMLCTDALGKKQCKLTGLDLGACSLTTECVRWLSEVLCDEHCKLTDLSLSRNAIGDEGVRMLCTDALRKKQSCRLIHLDLSGNNLTDQCVPLLCETLQDSDCKLGVLFLLSNDFSKKSRKLLRDRRKTQLTCVEV